MHSFERDDGCSGGNYRCDFCGSKWVDHIAPKSQCPMGACFLYGDVYGLLHSLDGAKNSPQSRTGFDAQGALGDVELVFDYQTLGGDDGLDGELAGTAGEPICNGWLHPGVDHGSIGH